MIKELKKVVPDELYRQWIKKSYAKRVTLGEAIVLLINMHHCLLLIENAAGEGS